MSNRRPKRPQKPKVKTSSPLDAYFGYHDKISFQPKLGLNYTQEALNNAAKGDEGLEIGRLVMNSFNQNIDVAVYPANFGSLVFPMVKLPRIDNVVAIEPRQERRNLLLQNIIAYQILEKTKIFDKYDSDQTAAVIFDLVEDPKLEIEKIITNDDIPLIAIRAKNNYQAKAYPGYVCHSEKLTSNPQHQLIICSLEEEEVPLDEETIAWRKKLVTFLRSFLSNFLSPEVVNLTLSEDVIHYWYEAFTHPSVDLDHNYEVLEMIGDRATKLSFADYIISRVPYVTEGGVTSLQNHFLAFPEQSFLGRKLGFGGYIRMIMEEVPPRVYEDILESSVGALFESLREVGYPGENYHAAFDMISWLYRDLDLDLEIEKHKEGTSKTAFLQRLQRFQLKPKNESGSNKQGKTHKIIFPEEALRFFSSRGVNLPSAVEGRGQSKLAAEVDAYDNALALLNENGVTLKWIDENHLDFIFSKPKLKGLEKPFRQRLTDEGFVNFRFADYKTTNPKNALTLLIGIRGDDSEEILERYEGPSTRSHVEVIKIYASMPDEA